MRNTSSPAHILTSVADTLVAKERYTSIEEALREIALAAVRSKTSYYRKRIHRLEQKHQMDFAAFTKRLQGRATPAQEDDWLAWQSARSMLNDWQETYQDLSHAISR